MNRIENALNKSHKYITRFVKEGSICVDATCGNGNDTLFLASVVGDTGMVYTFDIQDIAIEKTLEKLNKEGVANRVKLIKSSHEYIDNYIWENIDGAMFNLGYRPGGDHNISTKFATTKIAIEKILKLLKINGGITIVIYYGGDSGHDEKKQLIEYIEKLDCKKYIVMKTEFVNQINCPPIFVCIEKIS